MHGLACATETLTMLEIRQKRLVSRTIILLLIISWTSMLVMGVIDYRDGSTLRSATVVYILRVQTSLSYNVCNYVVQMT